MKNALFAIWLGYTTKTIMSVDKLVVQTKKKMDQKIKLGDRRLSSVGSDKYDTIELPISNHNNKQKYDSIGVTNLLETERNVLNAKDVNLDINNPR